MRFDDTISIEGAATALGVLGAAIGYLISLVRSWRFTYRDSRYRGTNTVILDILQQDPFRSLTEQELYERYCSDEMAEKRKQYRAWKPSKLSLLEFEGQLTHLQMQFLIDLAGKDSYSIRVKPPSSYDRQQAFELEVRDFVRARVTEDELRSAARQVFVNPPDQWARGRALKLLVRLKDATVIEDAKTALTGTDAKTAIEIAEVFAEYYGK